MPKETNIQVKKCYPKFANFGEYVFMTTHNQKFICNLKLSLWT